MDEIVAYVLDKVARHPGKVIGSILGFVIGWMIVSFGILKTLFIVFCLIVGYYVGTRFDSNISQSDFDNPFRRRNLR